MLTEAVPVIGASAPPAWWMLSRYTVTAVSYGASSSAEHDDRSDCPLSTVAFVVFAAVVFVLFTFVRFVFSTRRVVSRRP